MAKNSGVSCLFLLVPLYHPRGNYTERVNRCIGEWLRALVNTKSARKRDWVRYTKFVEFAYNSMFIPTNTQRTNR